MRSNQNPGCHVGACFIGEERQLVALGLEDLGQVDRYVRLAATDCWKLPRKIESPVAGPSGPSSQPSASIASRARSAKRARTSRAPSEMPTARTIPTRIRAIAPASATRRVYWRSPPGLLPAPARRLNARSFDRPATGRSCGALARVCGRGVLSPRRPRRALHHGPVAAFERGEDAAPDRADPPPHARSRPQDEPCGTSALGRVPQRPPLPLTGSGCQTRSRPDPGRARRPLRARLGRWSPPGKGIAPDLDPRGR
jgi:hypothetical protein